MSKRPDASQTPFWRAYHRLLDWRDDDDLPDPDKVDAAHWMNELYLAIAEGADCEGTDNKGQRVCRMALDAIYDGRPRIFPLGAKP